MNTIIVRTQQDWTQPFRMIFWENSEWGMNGMRYAQTCSIIKIPSPTMYIPPSLNLHLFPFSPSFLVFKILHLEPNPSLEIFFFLVVQRKVCSEFDAVTSACATFIQSRTGCSKKELSLRSLQEIDRKNIKCSTEAHSPWVWPCQFQQVSKINKDLLP